MEDILVFIFLGFHFLEELDIVAPRCDSKMYLYEPTKMDPHDV